MNETTESRPAADGFPALFRQAHVAAGDHEVRWDGRDEAGKRVASGVYLYQLRSRDFVETKRMVLLK